LSLNGNLEDLPLLDILQIVSFSKKTGYLAILTDAGEGAIVFRDGLVVSSFTWDAPPLDPRFMALPEEHRSTVVRTRIGIALEQLIRLREGQFSFNLSEEPPISVAGRDITGETLRLGINPQELLLELARGIDEDRRDSSAAVEASFEGPPGEAPPEPAPPAPPAAPPAKKPHDTRPVPVPGYEREPAPASPRPSPPPAPAPPPLTAELPRPVAPPPPPPKPRPEPMAHAAASEPKRRVLLLVDDEDDIRRVLGLVFAEAGYEVVSAADPEAAVKLGGKLGRDGVAFILVTDLGMPTSGASSFQGGFEVVKRLWKMNLRPPVLMMTESLSPALQLRAKQMKIGSFVFKPGLSKLNPKQFETDLLTFGQRLVVETLPRLERSLAATTEAPRPKKLKSAGGEEPAGGTPAPPDADAEELSRQFSLLQRRLTDLRRPTEAKEISLLVMKVAREFFERSILFLVKHEELRGLGGFGPAPKGQSLNVLARDVAISIAEPSVFRDAVAEGRLHEGPLPEQRWSSYLMGKIGRFQSNAVALLPLVTHRETIAVLFGDNAETGRPFGRLDALEVFVIQAGVAFENAFLQRKIQSLQGRSG
jgi:CheY-like chemotaxis protein